MCCISGTSLLVSGVLTIFEFRVDLSRRCFLKADQLKVPIFWTMTVSLSLMAAAHVVLMTLLTKKALWRPYLRYVLYWLGQDWGLMTVLVLMCIAMWTSGLNSSASNVAWTMKIALFPVTYGALDFVFSFMPGSRTRANMILTRVGVFGGVVSGISVYLTGFVSRRTCGFYESLLVIQPSPPRFLAIEVLGVLLLYYAFKVTTLNMRKTIHPARPSVPYCSEDVPSVDRGSSFFIHLFADRVVIRSNGSWAQPAVNRHREKSKSKLQKHPESASTPVVIMPPEAFSTLGTRLARGGPSNPKLLTLPDLVATDALVEQDSVDVPPGSPIPSDDPCRDLPRSSPVLAPGARNSNTSNILSGSGSTGNLNITNSNGSNNRGAGASNAMSPSPSLSLLPGLPRLMSPVPLSPSMVAGAVAENSHPHHHNRQQPPSQAHPLTTGTSATNSLASLSMHINLREDSIDAAFSVARSAKVFAILKEHPLRAKYAVGVLMLIFLILLLDLGMSLSSGLALASHARLDGVRYCYILQTPPVWYVGVNAGRTALSVGVFVLLMASTAVRGKHSSLLNLPKMFAYFVWREWQLMLLVITWTLLGGLIRTEALPPSLTTLHSGLLILYIPTSFVCLDYLGLLLKPYPALERWGIPVISVTMTSSAFHVICLFIFSFMSTRICDAATVSAQPLPIFVVEKITVIASSMTIIRFCQTLYRKAVSPTKPTANSGRKSKFVQAMARTAAIPISRSPSKERVMNREASSGANNMVVEDIF